MTLSMRRPSKNASMNGATLSYEPLASTHVMLTNALGSAPSRSYVPLYEGMVVLARWTAASLEPAWQGGKMWSSSVAGAALPFFYSGQ